MGKIIELDFRDIIPTQGYLMERYLEEFLYSYLQNADKKVIVPVARWKENLPYYTLIDGHHRTSILYLLNKIDNRFDIHGWLTENSADFIDNLPGDFYQIGSTIEDMNKNITRRFKQVKNCPYLNLEELMNQYSYMVSPEALMSKFYPEPVLRIN